MTASAPVESSVRATLVLATGMDAELPAGLDWSHAYATAHTERLAVLAWSRGGDRIRAAAPPEVVAAWRAEAVAADELARMQMRELRELSVAFESRPSRPIVLKGIPLAAELYGDVAARACCDIDLYVAAEQRGDAHRALGDAGWHHWYGETPFDASYRKSIAGATIFLEVHSSLTAEALAHCRMTPDRTRTWSGDDFAVAMLDDLTLVVYLAANIAKRATPPLISFLDLAHAWDRLDASARNDVMTRARRTGLSGCLEWGRVRARALNDAALGERKALRLLGVGADRRKSVHAYVRLAMLADTPVDASRILGAWLWPRSLRRAPQSLPAFWRRRMQRSFKGRFVYSRTYGG
ncbi:MAG: nucleotidyltransferase family protein [Gemmatimonadaceae bacterium]